MTVELEITSAKYFCDGSNFYELKFCEITSAKYFCERQGAEVRIDWSVVIPHEMSEN